MAGSSDKIVVYQEGINISGDRWEKFRDGQGGLGYRYHNSNGSFYCRSPDGYSYYDSGKGYTWFATPEGHRTYNPAFEIPEFMKGEENQGNSDEGHGAM